MGLLLHLILNNIHDLNIGDVETRTIGRTEPLSGDGPRHQGGCLSFLWAGICLAGAI